MNYGNEAEVGEAIRRSDVPREEIVVTSKIPGRHHGYDDAIASTRESLERLGLDRIDVHVIHWPNPDAGEVPRGMAGPGRSCASDGLVRSIGVSNFTGEHLRRIIDESGVTPVLNQIELHPYFPQPEMRGVDDELGIVTESWSPLGKRQAPFSEPPVAARRRGARRHPRPGDPALAAPARQPADPQVRHARRGSARTSTSTASSSPTTRSPRSPALARPDGRLFGGDPDTHEEM